MRNTEITERLSWKLFSVLKSWGPGMRKQMRGWSILEIAWDLHNRCSPQTPRSVHHFVPNRPPEGWAIGGKGVCGAGFLKETAFSFSMWGKRVTVLTSKSRKATRRVPEGQYWVKKCLLASLHHGDESWGMSYMLEINNNRNYVIVHDKFLSYMSTGLFMLNQQLLKCYWAVGVNYKIWQNY